MPVLLCCLFMSHYEASSCHMSSISLRLRLNCDTMNTRSKRQKQESQSPVETLRIDRTTYNQDEFAMRCGIPRATYQRWIAGKAEARLTLGQLKSLCRELGIIKIDDLPDGFGIQTRLSQIE